MSNLLNAQMCEELLDKFFYNFFLYITILMNTIITPLIPAYIFFREPALGTIATPSRIQKSMRTIDYTFNDFAYETTMQKLLNSGTYFYSEKLYHAKTRDEHVQLLTDMAWFLSTSNTGEPNPLTLQKQKQEYLLHHGKLRILFEDETIIRTLLRLGKIVYA